MTRDLDLPPGRPDPAEVDRRFEEMRKLADGWYGEGSRAPSGETLQRARAHLQVFADAGIDQPYIFPTFEGGVQAEWPMPEGSAEVEIYPGGDMHCLAVWVGGESDLTSDAPGEVAAWLAALPLARGK